MKCRFQFSYVLCVVFCFFSCVDFLQGMEKEHVVQEVSHLKIQVTDNVNLICHIKKTKGKEPSFHLKPGSVFDKCFKSRGQGGIFTISQTRYFTKNPITIECDILMPKLEILTLCGKGIVCYVDNSLKTEVLATKWRWDGRVKFENLREKR